MKLMTGRPKPPAKTESLRLVRHRHIGGITWDVRLGLHYQPFYEFDDPNDVGIDAIRAWMEEHSLEGEIVSGPTVDIYIIELSTPLLPSGEQEEPA